MWPGRLSRSYRVAWRLETGMHRTLLRLYSDETGAAAIEYALIAVLLSVAIVGGVTLAGGSVQTLYGSISSRVADALPP